MASVGKLRQKRVKATMLIAEGETLNLFHNPARLTPEFEDFIKHSDDIEGSAALVAILERCLIEWDLTADTPEDAEEFLCEVGAVVPLTACSLSKLPTPFLIEMAQALRAEQAPDPNLETPKRSGSFS